MRAAVQYYGLPPGTRVYATPKELANDPDVDSVVCATRVDKHAEAVLESVRSGKSAFVEWPLAENAAVAKSLVESADQCGTRTIVGLQEVQAPILKVWKRLLSDGHIGKVLSSELRVFGGANDRNTVPEKPDYFSDRKVGGNIFTIGFAHSKCHSKVF